MKEVSKENRLEQLKALRDVLAGAIDKKPGARDLASLAKQYRETIKEIEEIEAGTDETDEISEIIKRRGGVGVARADKKS
jgi:hypothetical protein